jgi:hypothetical protein
MIKDEINLREIFDNKIRNRLFALLSGSPLGGWGDSTALRRITDSIIAGSTNEINFYIRQNDINLLNMDDHVDAVMDKILLPRVRSIRVK